MKKLIMLIVSMLLLFSSCSVEKKKVLKDFKIDSSHYEKINERFEKLDLSIFSSGPTYSVIRGDTVYQSRSEFAYYEKNRHGRLLRSIDRPGSGYPSIEIDYRNNRILVIRKKYDENGNLREKGNYCIYGFKLGIWFEYNSDGRLINRLDYDRGYLFTAKDMFKYCLKHKIPIDNPGLTRMITILKTSAKNGNKLWVIEYPEKNAIVTLALTAAEGRLIHTSQTPFQEEE